MRGEHVKPLPFDTAGEGSSPHARGTRRCSARRRAVSGIIPACAGNTSARPRQRSGKGDHPRMRGEHSSALPRYPPIEGSSPHARGTLPGGVRLHVPPGIIPACAGNTPSPTRVVPACWDHPRMRGEHKGLQEHQATYEGSSPHARGTRFVTASAALDKGIIPACAGNTPASPTWQVGNRDHPRMRGEHLHNAGTSIINGGSSPHARGTQSNGAEPENK